MSRNYFRIFGALTLLLGPTLFAPRLFPIFPLSRFFGELVVMSAIELVGFGLAFQRRWAALYLSVPLFCYGVPMFFVSIYNVVFPLNLLAMLFALSLTLPLIGTIRYWRQLTWGGRFF